MKLYLKLRGDLAARVRADLGRPHSYAFERVGFLSCRAARVPGDGLLILAEDYLPVPDEQYLQTTRYGALIGSAAIRAAMQVALTAGSSIFHVHIHEHRGLPDFSPTDIVENDKVIPDFFNVAPNVPHGAVLLSRDKAIGRCWLVKGEPGRYFDEFSEIGAPTRISWFEQHD